MSKTDKTTPWRVAEKRGDCGRQCGYPCQHINMSKQLVVIKRKLTRAERTRVRAAIAKGIDPPVDQHRHRALWDLV